jgi:pimeloyl-ACP methyl ester carboxylesterase
MKPLVVSVHGINSKGAWQEGVESVLGPFFRCVSVKYPYYRPLGAFKLILEPWIFWLTAGLYVVARITSRWLLIPQAYYNELIWVVVVFGAAHVAARIRRSLALRRFRTTVETAAVPGDRGHLIAHSFGTFLAGRALEKYSHLEFDSMIFVGCVLARDFDWDQVLRKNPRAFNRIRNEVALRDRVVKLAYRCRRLVKGLGDAGVSGFTGPGIHRMESPWDNCSCCATEESRIHNVLYSQLGHSELLEGQGHAERFWLPFLWNMHPLGYDEFLGLCAGAELARAQKSMVLLDVVQRELRDYEADWTSGRLEEFVEREVRERCTRLSVDAAWIGDRVDDAIPFVWDSVNKARDLLRKQRVPSDDRRLSVLYPPTAIGHAVERAMKQASRGNL